MEAFLTMLVVFQRPHDSDEVSKREAFIFLEALEEFLKRYEIPFIQEVLTDWSIIRRFYEREKDVYLEDKRVQDLRNKIHNRLNRL